MFKKPIVKKILIVLAIVFVILQFFRPEKNQSGVKTNSIYAKYQTPKNVIAILNKACMDCHSNYTVYPWYTNIQPVGLWMNHHIEEGKEHLNFDEFLSYKVYRQYHKIEEVDEVIQEAEMPMSSYTLVHTEAKLTQEEKDLLINWSKSIRSQMEAEYPEDSLEKLEN